MKRAAPCQGCRDRQVGCHSGCERYRAYREAVRKAWYANRGRVEVNDYESKNSFFRQEGPHGR